MKVFSARTTMVIACCMYFGLGIVVGTHGPVLPELAANTGSTLAAVGTFFTAFFLGALVAQLIAGPLNDRFGQRPVLLVGLVLLGLGELGLTLSNALVLLWASALITGFGAGPIQVSLTLLITELFPERRSAVMNLLNVFFGIGATAGPAMAGLSLRMIETAFPVLWFGAALFILLIAAVPRITIVKQAGKDIVPVAASLQFDLLPAVLLLGTFLLLYVGTETGVGGWTTAYLDQTTNLPTAMATFVAAGFWLALTLGRLIAVPLSTRISSHTLLLGSLAGALVGATLLANSTGDILLSTIAVLVLGVCLGPVYPTAIAVTTTRFREATGTVTSIVIAIGSLGGMLLPWLQGVLMERSGLQASVLLIVVTTVTMLVFYAAYCLLDNRRLTKVPRPLEHT